MSRVRLSTVWFEAPEQPLTGQRIRIDRGASATRLAFALIRSAGWYALAGAATLVCFNVATMLRPVVVGLTIDRGVAPVAAGEPWREGLHECLLWVGLVALSYVVINLSGRFGGRLGWYGVQRARHELSDRVLSRVLDTHADGGRSSGSLLSLATLDVQRACQAIYVAVYPLGEVVAVVVAGTSLFLIHPALGFAVLIGAPLLLGIMALVARPLMERSEVEQEGVADATAAATDLVAGFRVIAGIHAQQTAAERYRRVSQEALAGTISARSALSAFEGVNTTLTGLFSAAVAVGAAGLAFTGEIRIGELIAAAGIAQVLLGPLQSLVGEAGAVWTMALASSARISEFLDATEHPETKDPDPRYDDEAPVLSGDELPFARGGLDLEVRQGEFVVVDLHGSDGQLLVDALALRERRSESATGLAGRIRYRGVPLVDLDPDRVRADVLVVPHQPDLFDGSVLSNVGPVGAIDEASARAALRVAHCESFEEELAEGYATSVGERGSMLSGGQRQRIALARAMAADAPLLVLHEPTNAVDSVSEATIAARVREARRGHTTVVLSSSAAFRSVADRVLEATETGVAAR